jgi:hypothetical protein
MTKYSPRQAFKQSALKSYYILHSVNAVSCPEKHFATSKCLNDDASDSAHFELKNSAAASTLHYFSQLMQIISPFNIKMQQQTLFLFPIVLGMQQTILNRCYHFLLTSHTPFSPFSPELQPTIAGEGRHSSERLRGVGDEKATSFEV